MADAAGTARPPGSLRQSLPYVGLVIGVWAAIAPYALLGPDLNAAAKNEFVDHVVPGALILVLSAVSLVRARSAQPSAGGSFPLLAGFGILLAGLWMTATHLPLVKEAQNDVVATDVTAWHTIPGIVVMILGGIWAASAWSDAAEEPATVKPANVTKPAGKKAKG
ncbi:MAG: hypothetical protein ACR2MO_16775 [Acidimicrobiales bacterium]